MPSRSRSTSDSPSSLGRQPSKPLQPVAPSHDDQFDSVHHSNQIPINFVPPPPALAASSTALLHPSLPRPSPTSRDKSPCPLDRIPVSEPTPLPSSFRLPPLPQDHSRPIDPGRPQQPTSLAQLIFSIASQQKQSLPIQLAPDQNFDLDALHALLCSDELNHLRPRPAPLIELCQSLAAQLAQSQSQNDVQQSTVHTQPRLRKRALADPDRHWLYPRQSLQGNGSGPAAEGYPTCTAVSNAVLSCFPRSGTTLVQHTWSKFIWNNNYPTFIGSRFVDIYLFNAQSETPVANWTSIANDRGMIGIYASDDWFPSESSWQDGRNMSFPYFFVITTAGARLTGGEQHQSTFTVLQTAPAAAFVSSSLAAAAAASGAAASLTSFENAASASLARPSPSPNPNSSLQRGGGGDSFPKWEIALIVILGTFALLTFLVASYLAFTNARRRRQVRLWQQTGLGGGGGSLAGSVGSHSPMIQNTEGAALMGNQRGAGKVASSAREMGSPNSSRPGSPLSAHVVAGPTSFAFPGESGEKGEGKDGPITSVDATMMADAFRKALRKPEFVVPQGEHEEEDGDGPEEEPPGGRRRADEGDGAGSAVGKGIQRVRESMHAQVHSVEDLDREDDDQEQEEGQSRTDREESSTEHHDDEEGGIGGDEEEEEGAKEIMDRELASEGRSMTSVEHRKRPTVHS